MSQLIGFLEHGVHSPNFTTCFKGPFKTSRGDCGVTSGAKSEGLALGMFKSCAVIKIDFLWAGFSLGGDCVEIEKVAINDGFSIS